MFKHKNEKMTNSQLEQLQYEFDNDIDLKTLSKIIHDIRLKKDLNLKPSKLVYLDYAGAGLTTKTQLKSIFDELNGYDSDEDPIDFKQQDANQLDTRVSPINTTLANPHSNGILGNYTHHMVQKTREMICQYLNTTTNDYDIIFTHGATHSFELLNKIFNFQKDSYFAYAMNSHTSVVGMRKNKNISKNNILAIPINTVYQMKYPNIVDNSIKNIENRKNNNLMKTITRHHMFVCPGECNFSGIIYDLINIGSCIYHHNYNSMHQEKDLNASDCADCVANKDKREKNSLLEWFINNKGKPVQASTVENSKTDIIDKDESGNVGIEGIESVIYQDKWSWCLDASKYVCSKPLDLNSFLLKPSDSSSTHVIDSRPDFIVFPFYKCFGYPTGIGVLCIKKIKYINPGTGRDVGMDHVCLQNKDYFGGGTISSIAADSEHTVLKPTCFNNAAVTSMHAVSETENYVNKSQIFRSESNDVDTPMFNMHDVLEDGTLNYQGIAGKISIYFV